MKNLSYIFPILYLALSCAQSNESSDSEPVILFTENVDDWFTDGNANWEFLGNELTGTLDSGAGFVITKNTYKNFVLTLEFNPDSMINSGVFVRCKDQQMSFSNCYEINIWDLHPNQDNRTGAVVARVIPSAKVETVGKWNTYEIRCEGNRIIASINGIQTVDMVNDELSEGFIGLQAAETGKIRFRNVKVRPLK